MKNDLEKGHEVTSEDWWTCKQCKAEGPAMNKTNCPGEMGRKRIPEEVDKDIRKRAMINAEIQQQEKNVAKAKGTCKKEDNKAGLPAEHIICELVEGTRVNNKARDQADNNVKEK
eukprot:5012293-Heterocapsa_arctica.AAC.1